MRQLRGERRTVDGAVEELRTMLMQSVTERTRLAGVLAMRFDAYPPPCHLGTNLDERRVTGADSL